MSTHSFIQTNLKIEKEDVKRFSYILNKSKRISLRKIENHQDIKGKDVKEFAKKILKNKGENI